MRNWEKINLSVIVININYTILYIVVSADRQRSVLLTDSFSRRLGVEDRAGVVCVELRLQKRHGHRTG